MEANSNQESVIPVITSITMKKKKNPIGKISLFIIILLIITLPFHYCPTRLKVFPKVALSFRYTLITEDDIESVINGYNTASTEVERQAIANDPFVMQLFEYGLIVRNK